MSWSRADTNRWAPPAALMLAIFVASSFPGPGLPPGSLIGTDKLIHAAIYALLGALMYRATGRPVWAIVLTAAYGCTDELHQALVPGRFADPFDAIADAVGAVLGVASTWASRPRRKGRWSRRHGNDDGDHPQLQGKASGDR